MTSKRSPTNSLERALILLELLARHPGGLTNAEISRNLHIASSTSSYILRRLERAGFVRLQPETRKYEIGLRIVALAQGALQALGLRQVVRPLLHSLVEQTQLQAVVAVLDRGRALVVERLETPEYAKSDVAVGTRLPVHCTALGKCLIAHVAEEDLNRVLARHGMRRFTRNTIVSRERLMQELQNVRQAGYASADEENRIGVRAVAAPIRDSAGVVIACVSANGSISHPAWSHHSSVVELVKRTAQDISRRMNTF